MANLSNLLVGAFVTSLHMPEPSQCSFPHLFLHKGHFHLAPNIFILNHIPPSMPTDPFMHPNLRYLHLLNMSILDWQHSAPYTNVGLTTVLLNLLLSLGVTFLSHKTPEASLYFTHSAPIRRATTSSISHVPCIINQRYLKLPLLRITCVSIFTSASASCAMSLNLHSKYSVFVLLNLNL